MKLYLDIFESDQLRFGINITKFAALTKKLSSHSYTVALVVKSSLVSIYAYNLTIGSFVLIYSTSPCLGWLSCSGAALKLMSQIGRGRGNEGMGDNSYMDWDVAQELVHVEIGTGNPWVFFSLHVPIPTKTLTVSRVLVFGRCG